MVQYKKKYRRSLIKIEEIINNVAKEISNQTPHDFINGIIKMLLLSSLV